MARKIFFWPIRSGQFKRFWNWFGKSKCPRARVDLTVNFHHKHFIDPTNCPWVSEDGIFLKEERDRELTISLSSELNILGPEKILKTENCNKSGRSIACESLLNCKACCAVGTDLPSPCTASFQALSVNASVTYPRRTAGRRLDNLGVRMREHF